MRKFGGFSVWKIYKKRKFNEMKHFTKLTMFQTIAFIRVYSVDGLEVQGDLTINICDNFHHRLQIKTKVEQLTL